jgi:hypothetical protein
MVRTGLVFEELYMWHDPGNMSFSPLMQPIEHWEGADSKRRFYNLLVVSGLIEKLHKIRARVATREELLSVHTGKHQQNSSSFTRFYDIYFKQELCRTLHSQSLMRCFLHSPHCFLLISMRFFFS